MMLGTAVMLSLPLSAADVSSAEQEQRPSREASKKAEKRMKDPWVTAHLTDAKATPPFSFVYEGPTKALLAEWPKKVSKSKKLDHPRTQHVLTSTEPEVRLEFRCGALDYEDYRRSSGPSLYQ